MTDNGLYTIKPNQSNLIVNIIPGERKTGVNGNGRVAPQILDLQNWNLTRGWSLVSTARPPLIISSVYSKIG